MQFLFSTEGSSSILQDPEIYTVAQTKTHPKNEKELTIKYFVMLCRQWERMNAGNKGILDSTYLAQLLIKNSTFLTPGQNDVSEAFMEILENELMFKQYRNEFLGKYKNTTVCQFCHDHSTAYSEFTSLLIELPDDKTVHSIATLISKHCASEFLTKGNETKCDKCLSTTRAQKKEVIDTFPNNLVIFIKRASANGSKMTNPVRVNGSFTIVRNDTNYNYSLRATCNHIGGMSHGHYIALTSRPMEHPNARRWFYCNDEEVLPIRPENVYRESSSVCLLLYRKVGL
jgi:ubiquitin C-terminal hydrolase